VSRLLRALQIPQRSQLQGEAECWVGDGTLPLGSTAQQQSSGGSGGGPGCSLAELLSPVSRRGTVPEAISPPCMLLLWWDRRCHPSRLNFSFLAQIDHTEVDTIENRQNGRPASSLSAPKSAVSPHPHLCALALARFLLRFGKGEVTPCPSTLLLTSLRQHPEIPSKGGRQMLGTAPPSQAG